MLGNRIQSFSQFILERADWSYAKHYAQYLRKFEGDSVFIDRLNELDSLLNDLENNWWYNREGRTGHYALNMKMNQWPDLDKWAAAKGEEDEDEITEDAMYNDWARFMEETYEMSSEDYINSYYWIDKIGAGGRQGGWLLIYPRFEHSDLEHDLENQFDRYLGELDQLEDASILADIARLTSEDSDVQELIDMGLINQEDFEAAQDVIKAREDLDEFISDQLRDFNQVNDDLHSISRNIEEFKNTAEANFYEWLKELAY